MTYLGQFAIFNSQFEITVTSLGKILIVDDDPDVLLAARLLLKQSAEVVRTERDPRVLPALLKEESFDIILLDMNFTRDVSSGSEGFTWLERIREVDPTIVVVLITAYGDVELAVRAIKAGATDFVLKPWQNEKLLATLSAAMSLRESRGEVERLRDRERHLQHDLDRRFGDFIGTSLAMRRIFTTIEKVAPTEANVLIIGENGTGKELAAREVHRRSNRKDSVFIGVDTAAIPSGLFESELFGHVRGAFTDAREDRAGRFESASGGTLFLDEIGNLPLPLQSKLLSVLQNRQVTRLGSNRAMPVDIRLICASNASLKDLVARREFREDLYYRIQTVELRMPPLRERAEDIPLLVEHFLQFYGKKYQKSMRMVDEAAYDSMRAYSWPGNVRELQHTVERATIMSDHDSLRPSDLALGDTNAPGPIVQDGTAPLEEIERAAIERALRAHDGNITHAAKELGLTRTALYRRLEKHGL